MNKEDIIKFIDGIPFYRYEYADFLYQKLEEKDETITNLQEENEKLLKKSYSDDVRITKAIEYIKEEQELTDIDEVINTTKLLNILNGGDDNE